MPGQPRRMAKKVRELEEQAVSPAAGVFLEIPARYRERPTDDDAMNRAWSNAVRAPCASVELERSGDLLRAKGGIAEPRPAAQFLG